MAGDQYIQSGRGGYIIVNGNRFDIARWELTLDPRLIERTNTTPRVAGARIGTRYRVTVIDPSWKVEFPWDNNQTPAVAGLIPGHEVNLFLFRGESFKGYAIHHTTIGPVELVNDAAHDVVRGVTSGRGGDITDELYNQIDPVLLDDNEDGSFPDSPTPPASGSSTGDYFPGGGTEGGSFGGYGDPNIYVPSDDFPT